VSLSTQFLTLAHMALAGIYLGAIFDTYFRLRGSASASWVRMLEDLLFWLINGVLVFFWLQVVNQGQMRFSVLVAIACGYLIYRSLFHTIYMKCLNMLLAGIAALYRGVVFFITWVFVRPVRFIVRLVLAAVLFGGGVLFGIVKWWIKPLTALRHKFLGGIKKKEEKKGFLSRVANRIIRRK